MPYELLTELGYKYKNEAGNASTERHPVLEKLSGDLQRGIAIANRMKQEAMGTKVATNLPGMGLKGERVKALVNFHESETNKWRYLDRINTQVSFYRQWLSRQGAWQRTDGTIIWNKSERKVEYDTTLEKQGLTRITFDKGLMYLQGKLLDTDKMVTCVSGPGMGIYVMSKEGHFHVSSHAVGNRHHSSLLGGGNVAGAGEMKVQNGKLVLLSNKSGHYQPDILLFLQTIAELKANQVPMTFQILQVADNRLCTLNQFLVNNHADDHSFEARKLMKKAEREQMEYFMRDNYVALLTAGVHPDVNTSGFHIMRDGMPYWKSPEEIQAMMLDHSVPIRSQYVRSGAGR